MNQDKPDQLEWFRVGDVDMLEVGRRATAQDHRHSRGWRLWPVMAEFTTAVKYNMNIILVLLNNSELAKISREQRGGNFHVWQTDLYNPSFAQYAENCGGLGIRVEQIEDLRPALEQAFAYDGPSLVDIISAADQL